MKMVFTLMEVMMSEFDKHWNECAIASNCTEEEAKMHFEAGQQSQQSQQAKIDELQSMVDEALNMLCKLQHSSSDRIYNDVGNILKRK